MIPASEVCEPLHLTSQAPELTGKEFVTVGFHTTGARAPILRIWCEPRLSLQRSTRLSSIPPPPPTMVSVKVDGSGTTFPARIVIVPSDVVNGIEPPLLSEIKVPLGAVLKSNGMIETGTIPEAASRSR